VSILMLAHNAPRYVERSIRTLVRYTRNVNYELVVVDNASDRPTTDCLKRLQSEGHIQHLTMLGYNSFFAGGNNIAARHAATDCSHLLLLNSDVEIRHPNWLSNLLAVHKPGITAYGVAEGHPLRVDGYCLLVDAPLYREHWLDENHQFHWAVTKFQAALLAKGLSVQGYLQHEDYLHHFGGKSGKDFKSAKGLVVTPKELADLFHGRTVRVLDATPDGTLPPRPRRTLIERGMARFEQLLS